MVHKKGQMSVGGKLEDVKTASLLPNRTESSVTENYLQINQEERNVNKYLKP